MGLVEVVLWLYPLYFYILVLLLIRFCPLSFFPAVCDGNDFVFKPLSFLGLWCLCYKAYSSLLVDAGGLGTYLLGDALLIHAVKFNGMHEAEGVCQIL